MVPAVRRKTINARLIGFPGRRSESARIRWRFAGAQIATGMIPGANPVDRPAMANETSLGLHGRIEPSAIPSST